MEEYKKSFKYWKTQEVEKVFGVKRSKDKSQLIEWENADFEITEREREDILSLQADLAENVEYWNEATLKFFFLGPFVRLIRYKTEKYSPFLEVTLKLKLNDEITISGSLDFLVATGYQIPEVPFFTLHEYKPEPNFSGDPQGQLLMGMIAAQKANEAKNLNYPLYGVYVIGRLWFFVILDKKRYIKSRAYDATQDDIFKIFCMLRKAKEYINKEVEELEKK